MTLSIPLLHHPQDLMVWWCLALPAMSILLYWMTSLVVWLCTACTIDPSIVVACSTTIVSNAPVDGYHHLGSNGTSLSWLSWLAYLWVKIIACMASICLLASLPVLHPARAIWPHSNTLLICGMVIPLPAKSLTMSSTVVLSNICASVIHVSLLQWDVIHLQDAGIIPVSISIKLCEWGRHSLFGVLSLCVVPLQWPLTCLWLRTGWSLGALPLPWDISTAIWPTSLVGLWSRVSLSWPVCLGHSVLWVASPLLAPNWVSSTWPRWHFATGFMPLWPVGALLTHRCTCLNMLPNSPICGPWQCTGPACLWSWCWGYWLMASCCPWVHLIGPQWV